MKQQGQQHSVKQSATCSNLMPCFLRMSWRVEYGPGVQKLCGGERSRMGRQAWRKSGWSREQWAAMANAAEWARTSRRWCSRARPGPRG